MQQMGLRIALFHSEGPEGSTSSPQDFGLLAKAQTNCVVSSFTGWADKHKEAAPNSLTGLAHAQNLHNFRRHAGLQNDTQPCVEAHPKPAPARAFTASREQRAGV